MHPLDGLRLYTHGNGIVTAYRFDQAGGLTAIEHGRLFKASYRYDAIQRLVSENLPPASE